MAEEIALGERQDQNSEPSMAQGRKPATQPKDLATKKDHARFCNVRTTQVYLVATSRLMCYLARAQLGALLPFLTQELMLTSTDRGHLMSRYASGYLLTQIPGGMLADKLGGKIVIAIVIVSSALCCVAAPLLASAGSSDFGIPFFLLGFAQGMVLPAGNVLMAQWVLPTERSWASAITGMGACLGTLIINFLAAPIASHFGWRTVFYSTAWACIAFLVAWLAAAVSSPDQCGNLSQDEYVVLQQAGLVTGRPDARVTYDLSESHSPKANGKKQRATFNPSLFLHTAVWTVILCNFVQNCQQYFAEWLPYFYSTQLAMSPDLASFHLTMIALVEMPARTITKDMPGQLQQRGFSLLQCRQVMSLQGFSYHLVLCGLLGLFMGFEITWPLAYTVLFALSKAVQAFHSGGYFANYLDLTRNYAGMLTGIGNTVASCAGVIVPQFIAQCLQNGDTNWLPVIAALMVINVGAILLVAKGMSTRCLDELYQ